MWGFAEVQERRLPGDGRENSTLEINPSVFLSELQYLGLSSCSLETVAVDWVIFPSHSLTAEREHRREAGGCQ